MTREYIKVDKVLIAERDQVRRDCRVQNLCCWCSKFLNDRRKAYCSRYHKYQFWKKYAYCAVWWSDIRRKVLRRDNWLCQRCLRNGTTTSATEVHHIKEIQDGGDEFAEGNCESLCRQCHKVLTAENRVKRTES